MAKGSSSFLFSYKFSCVVLSYAKQSEAKFQLKNYRKLLTAISDRVFHAFCHFHSLSFHFPMYICLLQHVACVQLPNVILKVLNICTTFGLSVVCCRTQVDQTKIQFLFCAQSRFYTQIYAHICLLCF